MLGSQKTASAFAPAELGPVGIYTDSSTKRNKTMKQPFTEDSPEVGCGAKGHTGMIPFHRS